MAAEITFYSAPPLHYGTSQGALTCRDLGTLSVAIAADASAGAAVPADARYAVVTTDEACRIKFGGAAVVAEKTGAGISRKLLGASEYPFLVQNGDHVSLIAVA
ncbi:MAG TPA: hypothetical protein VGW34_10035 [Allosphingosinicella sp.]|nr:hypothetical protein [Allosphingosinicella sp.]